MKEKNIISVVICISLVAISISSVMAMDYSKEVENDYKTLINKAVQSGIISTDDWIQLDKLLPSDGEVGDYFGWSVAIDGDYAIIGASDKDEIGFKSGVAYVFMRSGSEWIEEAKLIASDAEGWNLFGWSVAIDEEYTIIGAKNDNDNGGNSGSAYIFKRDGTNWIEEAKLLASDGEEDDWFGYSVSIDGDTAIVGSPLDDDNDPDSGSAYVFVRSGTVWTEQAKLLASDGNDNDRLGCSVSIDGDTAIVGARLEDDNGADSGSAYVFVRSGTVWTEQAKLVASDGNDGDQFGCSVSIEVDTAIVGAEYDDDNGEASGSAYVFIRSGTVWNEQTKLLASDGEGDDRFGCSVSIDGDNVIIGAHYDDDAGVDSGSAYIFKREGISWIEQAKLLASDATALDRFACSVSISGESAIIGAFANYEFMGSAYIFIKFYPPDLDCSGDLHWTEVTPGDTVYGSVTVENIGEPNSLLDWEIDSYPEWGTWTFDPDSGIDLLEGNSITIDVEVVAPDIQEETFTGEVILINSENASDTCVIDVSLATPVIQSTSYLFLQLFIKRFPNAFPILTQILGLIN